MASPILIDVPEELRGDRVVVRRYRTEDAEAVWTAIDESRERLLPWLPWVEGYRPDDARAFVARARARWLLREDLGLGIFSADDGGYLGGTGLHHIDWDLRTFVIGYWIRTGAEGKGYVSEAVRLLTRLAFDRLGANRVEITVDPRNERSLRVVKRSGYVLEGTLRRCAPPKDGVPTDRRIFSLIPEDYRRLPWAEQSLGRA